MQEAMWVDLEVLTPTHVGNGGDINPIEYWIDDDFARVHMDRLFADPDFSPHLDDFISNAASQRYLGRHLPSKLLSRHVRYQVPMSPEARKYLLRHQIQVKEYIKSAGRVFIPGSSIKGSLLSALISSTLGDRYRSEESKYSIERCIGDPRSFSELLDITIGSLKGSGDGAEKRFYRWLDVSDSSLLRPEKSLRIYYSEVVGARRGKLPILFEGLTPGTKYLFSLNSTPGSRFKPSQMLETADVFYREVWKKSEIKESPPEKGYLLRLGQGSSAWSTSLLIFAESSGARYRVPRPRTRKLVDAIIPMGWVLLSPSDRSSLAEAMDPNEICSDEETLGRDLAAPDRDSTIAGSPAELPPGKISTPETQVWGNVRLFWEPGSRTVVANTPGGKAFTKDLAVIPELIYDRLCTKRKPVQADIEVEQVGLRNFKIIRIE